MSELQKEELPKEVYLKGFQSGHRLSATNFLTEFAEYITKGYVLHPKPTTVRQLPTFVGSPRCTMVTQEHANEILGLAAKEEKIEKEAANPNLVKVKTLSKKDELLVFAKEVELEVPEDNIKKGAKSIKQFLINTLSE